MDYVIETDKLTKIFGSTTALDGVDLKISPHSIVGLLGRNGSGKTTLLRHLMGQLLPSSGSAATLGVPAARLGHDELTRIGYVPQDLRLLDWMTVRQQLDYVACFYPNWDLDRADHLLAELELDAEAAVGALSVGNLQKLGIILAVCHHPRLLLLDEPVSDLDPIVRAKLLQFLLALLREDEATILVSSHILRDVEKIVDQVVCLDRGKVVTDAALDDLKERYAEWLVVSRNGDLPDSFPEPFVLRQEVSGREARLLIDRVRAERDGFDTKHGVEIRERPLNLEEMFPLLIGENRS